MKNIEKRIAKIYAKRQKIEEERLRNDIELDAVLIELMKQRDINNQINQFNRKVTVKQ